MSATRRKFTSEFRAEAVKLVTGTGRPVAHVAAELGIGQSLLGRWVAKAALSSTDDSGALTDSDEKAELLRLRKENAELRLDREFLKKRRLMRVIVVKDGCRRAC